MPSGGPRNGRSLTREDLRESIEGIGDKISVRLDEQEKRLNERHTSLLLAMGAEKGRIDEKLAVIDRRFESLDGKIKNGKLWDAASAGVGVAIATLLRKVGL